MASTRQEREFSEMLADHLRQDSTLDECIQWIKGNMNPKDVFDSSDLEEWAEDAGYVLGGEDE